MATRADETSRVGQPAGSGGGSLRSPALACEGGAANDQTDAPDAQPSRRALDLLANALFAIARCVSPVAEPSGCGRGRARRPLPVGRRRDRPGAEPRDDVWPGRVWSAGSGDARAAAGPLPVHRAKPSPRTAHDQVLLRALLASAVTGMAFPARLDHIPTIHSFLFPGADTYLGRHILGRTTPARPAASPRTAPEETILSRCLNPEGGACNRLP